MSSLKKIDEEAASELIGVVLLISLAIIGISMIAVMFFSETSQVAIPKLETLVGDDPEAQIFYIYHNGGESLTAGTYSVMVDSGSGYEDKSSEFVLDGGDTIWSTGDSLIYDYSATGIKPESVNVVYKGEGQGTLITSTPLVYSQGGGVSAGAGDEGLNITYPDDDVECSNPVEIVTPSASGNLYYGYDNKNRKKNYDNLIAVFINNTGGFVADAVQYVVYNYDTIDPSDFLNDILDKDTIKIMSVDPLQGSGFDYFTVNINLKDIVDKNNIPDDFDAVLNIIAYNTTTGQIFSTSGKYVVVGMEV